jgi:hypothetical protein
MKKNRFKYLAMIFFVTILLIGIIPGSVMQADANSITVTPSTIIDSLASGSSRTYAINITNGFAVSIEVAGLGESTDGSTVTIPAANDTSSFTARPWVSVNQSQLEVGVSQNLNVTIAVPAGTQPGERYACIYMYSQPNNQGSATIISGIIIPIIITVNSSAFTANTTGQISNLSVPQPYQGKPVEVLTTFNNTGNCLISGARNEVTIKDNSGNVAWQNTAALPAPSVLPDFPRIIDAQYNVGLALGTYSVTSVVTLENGTAYTQSISFIVVSPPPIPAAPTLIGPGNSNTPGPAINTLTPAFQWNSISGADYYNLTVSRAPYSSSNVIYTSQQLTGTSFTLPSGLLFNGQTYCWQMTATNVSGTSNASNIFFFQTSGSYTAPAVTTINAIDVTSTSAILTGKLTSLGSTGMINVNFEYGADTNYGISTPVITLTTTGVFQTSITGLTPNTSYHFQANAGGVSIIYGNDETFTTLQAASTSMTTSTPTMTSTSNTTSTAMTTSTPTTISTSTTAFTPVMTSTPSTSSISDIAQYLLPGIEPSSLAGLSFNDVTTPYLNAIQQDDVEVTLTGINGNGSIIVGEYSGEPSDDVGFSSGMINGGTGKTGIKFVDVSTKGYIDGTAQVTIHYADAEVDGFNLNSLFLSYFDGGKWHECRNLVISTQNNIVSGDIPISELSGTPIGLGGDLTQTQGDVPFVPQSNAKTAGPGISWDLAGVVIVPILIVGAVIFMIERNRRRVR